MFKYYRSLGWSCIPAQLGAKRPPHTWKKYQTNFPTDEEIETWSKEAEDGLGGQAQIGIITGSLSKIIVLDIDSKEGWDYTAEHSLHLPPTVSVSSSPPTPENPKGKVHFYYKHPGNVIVPTKVKFLPGMDSRGDGGFVMAPPSMHKDNEHRYEWMIHPKDEEIADAPLWFLQALNCRMVKVMVSDTDLLPPEAPMSFNGVAKGERNATAAKLAGYWFARGMSEYEVSMFLGAWNLKNSPPLSERELSKVCKSIGRREATKRAVKVGTGEVISVPETQEQLIPWHEHRVAMLAGFSKRVGIEVIQVLKITGDDPEWRFIFPNGMSATMKTADIINNSRFRAKIFEQTGRMLKPISNKKDQEWDKMCQVISDAAEWTDAGAESTAIGEIRVAIEDYFLGFKPDVWDEGNRPPLNYPFIFENKVHIFLGHFLNYLQNNKGMKINLRDLAKRLTVLKFKNNDGKPKNIGGFVIRVWEVPANLMPPAPQQDAAEGKVVPIKRF